MIVVRYYVIYAEVPSGHLGVDLVSIPYSYNFDKAKARWWIGEEFINNYGRAVIDILEAKG